MAERRGAFLFPLAAAAALSAAACGSNNTNVPPELLAAIDDPGRKPASYPPGPYGTRQGDVTEDLCFDGWKDPKSAGYDETRLGRICFSDFHADPRARLLLVESCAIWCAACRSEYGGDGASRPSLSQRVTERASRGFRVLGTIFQDAASAPATPADAAAWAKTFAVDFPFAVDPDHQIGLFTSSLVAPYNVLIDTQTMQIVLELSGDEPSVLFAEVDRFLDGASP